MAFAVLCAHNPNFLILDEPTNHLDIQTIEALGNALIQYKVRYAVVHSSSRLFLKERLYCQCLFLF